MLIEVVVATIGCGLATTLVARTLRRGPLGVPYPAGPPEDRGEAVRRVLKHLQRRTIGELADGTAAVVEGEARAIPGVPLLRAPVTGVECLGYHLDVRAIHADDGFHSPQLREEARCVALDVVDATGTVRIDATGLELAITAGPIGRWEPPLPRQILALVPPQYHYWSVSVEEGVLLPGATVLVCGVAMNELAATDYRDGAETLVMRATATFPLVASTDADLFRAGHRPVAPEELRRPRR